MKPSVMNGIFKQYILHSFTCTPPYSTNESAIMKAEKALPPFNSDIINELQWTL